MMNRRRWAGLGVVAVGGGRRTSATGGLMSRLGALGAVLCLVTVLLPTLGSLAVTSTPAGAQTVATWVAEGGTSNPTPTPNNTCGIWFSATPPAGDNAATVVLSGAGGGGGSRRNGGAPTGGDGAQVTVQLTGISGSVVVETGCGGQDGHPGTKGYPDPTTSTEPGFGTASGGVGYGNGGDSGTAPSNDFYEAGGGGGAGSALCIGTTGCVVPVVVAAGGGGAGGENDCETTDTAGSGGSGSGGSGTDTGPSGSAVNDGGRGGDGANGANGGGGGSATSAGGGGAGYDTQGGSSGDNTPWASNGGAGNTPSHSTIGGTGGGGGGGFTGGGGGGSDTCSFEGGGAAGAGGGGSSAINLTYVNGALTDPWGTGAAGGTANADGYGDEGTITLTWTGSAPSPTSPTITGLSSSSGNQAGGTKVTITGTNLWATAVTFGGRAATITSASGSQLVVTIPPGTGPAPVVVTTSFGTASSVYHYDKRTAVWTATTAGTPNADCGQWFTTTAPPNAIEGLLTLSGAGGGGAVYATGDQPTAGSGAQVTATLSGPAVTSALSVITGCGGGTANNRTDKGTDDGDAGSGGSGAASGAGGGGASQSSSHAVGAPGGGGGGASALCRGDLTTCNDDAFATRTAAETDAVAVVGGGGGAGGEFDCSGSDSGGSGGSAHSSRTNSGDTPGVTAYENDGGSGDTGNDGQGGQGGTFTYGGHAGGGGNSSTTRSSENGGDGHFTPWASRGGGGGTGQAGGGGQSSGGGGGGGGYAGGQGGGADYCQTGENAAGGGGGGSSVVAAADVTGTPDFSSGASGGVSNQQYYPRASISCSHAGTTPTDAGCPGYVELTWIMRTAQAISFTTPPPAHTTVGGPTYTPQATATSGLSVTLTVDSSSTGICSMSEGVVSFEAPGTCQIDANQAGNSTTWAPAPQVVQTLDVEALQNLPVVVSGRQPYRGSPTFTFATPSPLPSGVTGVGGTLTGCSTILTSEASVGVYSDTLTGRVPSGIMSGCGGLQVTGPTSWDYQIQYTYADGTMTVTKAPTSFTITANGASTAAIATGTSATLAESGLPATATGTVTFTSGSTKLCTATLPATSCTTLTTLPAGSYPSISATFADTDGNHSGSTSTGTVALTVSAFAVTAVPNQESWTHAPVSLTLHAGPGTVTYGATNLPLGLTLTPSSGVISGTTATTATRRYVTVTATAGSSHASTSFFWTVIDPLVATNPPATETSWIHSPVTLTVPFKNATGSPLTYSATNLPVGLAITTSSGVISGTTSTTATRRFVTVTATDGTRTASASFLWTVTDPLAVTTPSTQASWFDTTVDLQIGATDAVSGATLTYSATNLPGGLSVGLHTGRITGTAAAVTTRRFVTVTVTSTSSAGTFTDGASFLWTVADPLTAPVTPTAQASWVGTRVTPVSAGFTATLGLVTYSATNLPPGLTVTIGTGVISGIPTAATRRYVTVTADVGSYSESVSFLWTVTAPFSLTAPPGQSGQVHRAVTPLAVAASTAQPGITVTYGATNLPPGLTMTTGTGVISGTPTTTTRRYVTVTATDGSYSAATGFLWDVTG